MKLGVLFPYEIQTAILVRNIDRYLDTKYRLLFGYEIRICNGRRRVNQLHKVINNRNINFSGTQIFVIVCN